jgi:hypothetical protein
LEKVKAARREKQNLLHYIDQETAKAGRDNEEIRKKTTQHRSQTVSSEISRTHQAPFLYLEQRYNCKVVKFELLNKENPEQSYVLDFILDQDIYARFKKMDGSHPVAQIMPGVMLVHFNP